MRIPAVLKIAVLLPVLWGLGPADGFAQCNPPNFGININSQANQAVASWPSVPSATHYEYFLGPYPSTPPVGGNPSTSANGVTLSLTPGTKYSFCVRSNCGGPQSIWNCDSFTAIVTAPCAAPASVTATATSTSTATASWTAVAGATGYEYGIALAPTIPSASTQTTSTSVPLSGLLSMGTYVFCVRTRCLGTAISSVQCDTLNTFIAANVDEVAGTGVHVYPNPVADMLSLVLPQPAEVYLTDVRGTKLYGSSQPGGTSRINTSHLAPGIYFLKIINGSGTATTRVQKL
jgi:hypothetical protein